MLHALFAQNPGNRVGNIALAAAIRPDNARYSITSEDEVSMVRKGLEARDFEASKLEHRQSVDLMRGVTPKLAPKTTYGYETIKTCVRHVNNNLSSRSLSGGNQQVIGGRFRRQPFAQAECLCPGEDPRGSSPRISTGVCREKLWACQSRPGRYRAECRR